MPSKSLLLIIVLSVLLVSSVVFSLVRKPCAVLERESLKVVVSDDFPTDLSCEVYLGSFDAGQHVLGSKQIAIFKAEGEDERIDIASMSLGLTATVRFLRKDPNKDSYRLQLSLEDKDGRLFSLYDLNLDGEWDVKSTLTGDQKKFIRLQNMWLEIDKIESLKAVRPTAKRGRTEYTFQEEWTPVAKAKPGRTGSLLGQETTERAGATGVSPAR